MLLDIAFSDAYGAGFEFAKPAVLAERPNDFTRYFTHNLDANAPGTYTDDTQMSLALAEWMLAPEFNLHQEDTVLQRQIAQAFLSTFHRDPRQAYSRRLFHFLKESRDVDVFLKTIDASSTRSGAAMRSAVLAYLPYLDDVRRIAPLQAAITHNTPEGKATSLAVAVAAWHHRRGACLDYALRVGATEASVLYVRSGGMEVAIRDRFRRLGFTPVDAGGVSVQGLDSVNAAFAALKKDDAVPEDLLRCIVAFGGDTDTVCAIAMGMLAAGTTVVWPAWCWDTFEDTPYGRTYLKTIAEQLDAKFGVPLRV